MGGCVSQAHIARRQVTDGNVAVCALQKLYTGVKDPTEVIEKYAAMWSYQPLFDGRRTR